MAIGGKTLGIVSGLAVGLTSGVILAALNPIVPQKVSNLGIEPNETAQSETATAEKNDPALPKLSMVDTGPEPEPEEAVVEKVEEPVVTEPEVEKTAEDTTEPASEDVDSVEPEQTAEPETLAPVEEPSSELAMVLPENTQDVDVETAPEQPSAAETETDLSISTETAEAVELAEPTLDTESPEVVVAEPVADQEIVVGSVAATEQTSEPSEIAASDTIVAALPIVEDPVAPKPAVAVVTEAPEDEKPNTSGTFETTGGSFVTQGTSLPTIGSNTENGLASLGTGKKSSRFKTIGDATEVTTENVSEPEVGALVRNANEFPVTDDPLMSIVLIDDGKISAKLPSLQNLNLPLTIAVSLDDADAAERAEKYRAAGFEVLAMTPRDVKLSLSGGQTKEQVAELLTQYFDILPNSVGLIDRPSANLQKDQRLSRAVVEHFGMTGHGIVTYAGGLNGTSRVADQENVSNGTVFRFLDKSGETGPVVTQQLDRAAREARSKGSVIVMATPSVETLGTLVSWSLSSKARAVTLAPISASLLKN